MDRTTTRVLVTGGRGFLGCHLVKRLVDRGFREVLAPSSDEYDLRDTGQVDALLSDLHPDVVVHLAAVVGGIGANRRHPGRFFYENAIMGIELMERSRLRQVSKFVSVGTICAYPKHTRVPFSERDLWLGYPEETNAPYGLAKKMLLVQGQAYREEYGFDAIHLIPTNLYGPGDSFDLESGHVIPALIRKCIEARNAGHDQLELWGDGSATREFLYVEDAAEAIALAIELYDGAEPVNLGSNREISIADLAALVMRETGFDGRIRWDQTKPNGQPRRCIDTSRAKRFLGFEARWDLAEGLRETIRWYESQRSP